MLLLDDLRHTLCDRPTEVVFVIGAGVAVGALQGSPRQDVATWTGLLRDGLRRAHDLDRLATGDFAAYIQLLNVPGAAIEVASAVERLLGAPHSGEYRRWLRETVGAFSSHVRDRRVLDVLARHQRRGALLATTNYDLLLEHVTQLPPVTWQDPAGVERALRGEEPQILHLHGVWKLPASVVLGSRSYEDVVRDSHAQTTLATLRTARTFVFVGCGAGLHDPNIGAFLRWSAGVFAGSEYRHFRLCLRSEIAALRSEHPETQRIYPLDYGESHEALAPFLQSLLPDDTRTGAVGPDSDVLPLNAPTARLMPDLGRGSLDVATALNVQSSSHSPRIAGSGPTLATPHKWLIGAGVIVVVAAVAWVLANAIPPPPPRIEACQIECIGCPGIHRAWIRSGDTYVVRTRGNVIEFFCPSEQTTVTAIIEIVDENLRISYRSAEIEFGPAEERILVRAEDFADEPITAIDLAGAKQMQSRWCGRGSTSTADGCRRIECPDGQFRRDGRCVDLMCADGFVRQGTRCVPLCAVDEVIRDGRCEPRCGKNARFEDGACVPLFGDDDPDTLVDDSPQTVTPAFRSPKQPARADALLECVSGSDDCEATTVRPKVEPRPSSDDSVDCILDPKKCQEEDRADYSVDCILDPKKCGLPRLEPKVEPPPGAPETLELADIVDAVKPFKNAAIVNCVRLSRGGEEIKVKLSISGPTGTVLVSNLVEVEFNEDRASLGRCVANELKRATFKKVQKAQIGTQVTVKFP